MNNNVYIIWKDIDDTGINLIDEQHRGIVSLINTLYFSMNEKRNKKFRDSLTDAIASYTKIHFLTEQYILEQSQFPNLSAHCKLHEDLIIKTKEVIKDATEQDNISILLKFLKEWWINHINVEDREYISHVTKYLNK